MHKSVYGHLSEAVRDFLDPKLSYTVVDFGAKASNDAALKIADLFKGYRHELTGVDIEAGAGVDIVLSSPYEIPLESGSVDVVICSHRFENIPYFWTTFLEMARLLKVGGRIMLGAPSRGHPHGGAIDAWRFYSDGFKALAAFAHLRLVRVHSDQPARADNGRYEYGSVTPYRYWGDTIGIFMKTAEYDQGLIDQVRTPLISWSKAVADVDATLSQFGPAPLGRGQSPKITHAAFGIDFPFDPNLINKKVADKMKNGRYEIREASAIQSYMKGGERVLELGGGLGFISTLVSRFKRPASYTVVEADPRLIPVIKETHKLNGVTGIRVENCVATSDPAALAAGFCKMKIAKTFWGSSIKAEAQGSEGVLVEAIPLEKFLQEDEPEVLIADIEGGELDLFTGIEMPTVNLVILELHPTMIGDHGVAHVEAELARMGLKAEPYDPATRVGIYSRRD
ncbi:methyltransferase domain-containing protein [Hansschlegelia sp.]|uniref:methyltransferase domain-containing protein n=1 Tax=Hansschlegelia sp. TaxID=2041892 RepID=UPI002B887F56|nr:methyltransferase domain-containing protein [Hansschlegelia sp.]HVI27303.1 methyltransferase domain-containing protein [Hansschlegelia sp.]